MAKSQGLLLFNLLSRSRRARCFQPSAATSLASCGSSSKWIQRMDAKRLDCESSWCAPLVSVQRVCAPGQCAEGVRLWSVCRGCAPLVSVQRVCAPGQCAEGVRPWSVCRGRAPPQSICRVCLGSCAGCALLNSNIPSKAARNWTFSNKNLLLLTPCPQAMVANALLDLMVLPLLFLWHHTRSRGRKDRVLCMNPSRQQRLASPAKPLWKLLGIGPFP